MNSTTYVVTQLQLLMDLHKVSRFRETMACCQAPADVAENESQKDVATIGLID